MKRLIALSITGCFAAASLAMAQDNPIKQRQAIMEENGKSTKLASQMLKGETPYDAAAASEAMKAISGSMDKFVKLFPEGSAEGSSAKPEIWQDKADFDSFAEETKKASAAAANAAANGLETFLAAFMQVGKNCKGCHEKYRVPEKK